MNKGMNKRFSPPEILNEILAPKFPVPYFVSPSVFSIASRHAQRN